MAGLLGEIYSAADQVKARAKGLLGNTGGFLGGLYQDAKFRSI
jgi:hypothetical protein